VPLDQAADPAVDELGGGTSALDTSAARPARRSGGRLPPGPQGPVWADRAFIPAAIIILLVAAALRLPELALNPFHHDEGVNGFFTTNLLREGVYRYDPANYHGPTLYYFALVSAWIFGLTTEAMRLVPVLFGMLTVALVLPMRRFIGPLAVLTGAALLAISPGAVYVSRYFIHESMLVGLTLALVVLAFWYLDTRRPVFLALGAVVLALIFATKETGIISVGVLLIAAVVSGFYVRWRTPAPARPAERTRRSAAGSGTRGDATDPSSWRVSIPLEHLLGAAIVFVVVYVLFYSSFFTNFPQGLIDSLATFTIWTQTGAATQIQPPQTYLVWMLRADAPILILGTVGGLIAAIRGRDRIWVCIGLWALGTTVAYSLVQYKTPWIVLNMLVPLALLAGLAIDAAWRSVRWRLAVPVALGASMLLSGYQAIDLNFARYDDEHAYPYVFVHSTRQMLDLVEEIEATAVRAGTGNDTGIVFVTPDYWPLPWYMREYPRAGFFGSIIETEEAMIVANVNQEAELEPQIRDRYDRVGQFNLRPGVDLSLWVRKDVPPA
jgi:uncharacterized protein (TIGR03663 family)